MHDANALAHSDFADDNGNPISKQEFVRNLKPYIDAAELIIDIENGRVHPTMAEYLLLPSWIRPARSTYRRFINERNGKSPNSHPKNPGRNSR